MIDLKGEKVDLVKNVLSAMTRSLEFLDPKTLFAVSPDITHPGNICIIDLLFEDLEKQGFKITTDFHQAVTRALSILIRSGDVKVQIFRNRLNGFSELGVAFPEELELLKSSKPKN